MNINMENPIKEIESCLGGLPCCNCERIIGFDMLETSSKCEYTDQFICEDCQIYLIDSDLEHFKITIVDSLKRDENGYLITRITSKSFADHLRNNFNRKLPVIRGISTNIIEVSRDQFVKKFEGAFCNGK